jgi:hypothetical protein
MQKKVITGDAEDTRTLTRSSLNRLERCGKGQPNNTTVAKSEEPAPGAPTLRSDKAPPKKIWVDSWQRFKLPGRHVYVVSTKDDLFGVLRVDDEFVPDRSIIAHMSWYGATEPFTYRNSNIRLPIALERAIVEERLRHCVRQIRNNFLDALSVDDPTKIILSCCDCLQHGFHGFLMHSLLAELGHFEKERGLEYKDALDTLRELKSDCERLWPKRALPLSPTEPPQHAVAARP